MSEFEIVCVTTYVMAQTALHVINIYYESMNQLILRICLCTFLHKMEGNRSGCIKLFYCRCMDSMYLFQTFLSGGLQNYMQNVFRVENYQLAAKAR